MAPPTSKRIKGTQVFRPFIYGTTATPFDPVHNPKPPGIPDDHTHSWTVFVKGIDDTDITYWLRRVQFKLHESIPNHVRMVEGEKGKPFVLHETGWGEFEIAIKLYYVPESSEKPQTLYHHLRLHPYGRTDEEKESMKQQNRGEVISWAYEEQLFNEPYEAFYEILTSGAMPPQSSTEKTKGSAGAGAGGGGAGGKSKEKDEKFQAVARTEGGVLDRSAMIPLVNRPGQMFSRETEQVEVKKLKEAMIKIEEMTKRTKEEMEKKEKRLKELRADGGKA
ncbi:protein AF-9 [Cladorrhinum samala]|uniref:Protein AF-9 homolog n=1 Tax=Cladorrhinum samala TaxID=585594 RepID=A0AAV9HH68_9PEZI|nr:protein AF-9 [Cladorrhinum samala]